MMAFNLPSLPSIHSLITNLGVGSLLAQVPFLRNFEPSESQVALEPFLNAQSCPRDGPLSCHSDDAAASCCFITPGGQLLQTQFWDTRPAVGPIDSWTLHGLWPDLCDGSYDQFCTYAPSYANITQILEAADQHYLLEYMNKYWLPNSGTAESFWEHEWNKHGTCVNTMAPSCYGDDYTPGKEVVDFFTRTVGLFRTLDTYTALANAGITPSTEVRYTLKEIQDALSQVTGYQAVVGCEKGHLNQAWYYYNVRGSLQTGDFVPTDPPEKGKRSCPSQGIRYFPKDLI